MFDNVQINIPGGLDFAVPKMVKVKQNFEDHKIDDVALAVWAELMRYSDVFDTDDTKDIIYRSVTNATREMVREWLDQNLATIAKEVINEALDKLSKNARN